MPEFSVAVHVKAPQETVFELASDFEHAPEMIRGIKRLEVLTPGPIGLGTRVQETRVLFGKEAVEQLELTAFDPPRRYTMECESCGCHYRARYRFIPDIWGTTIQLVFDSQPLTLLAKLMAPLQRLMVGPMKRCKVADLEDLKQIAQQRAAESEHPA